MRSKVKIDIDQDNRPIIRVTVPDTFTDEDVDVRDKLAQKFVWPAGRVKNHTAFSGIASHKLVRHGYPCIMEHFYNDEYVVRPLGMDIEDLEMLKTYIDTLIKFEKDKYDMHSCGEIEEEVSPTLIKKARKKRI